MSAKKSKLPKLGTFTNALKVAFLVPNKFPKPIISISNDGEISFEFIKGCKRVVIDIDEDKNFGYAYLKRGKFIPGKEIADTRSRSLPKDLLNVFSN